MDELLKHLEDETKSSSKTGLRVEISKSSSGSEGRKPSYVWEEEAAEEPRIQSIRIASSFSQPSNDEAESTSQAKINMVELQEKVKAMKDSLAKTVQTIRELQSEMIRLDAAKERRLQRCQQQFDLKRRTLLAEQAELKQQQQAVLSKLKTDIRELEDKKAALAQRQQDIEAHYEHLMDKSKAGLPPSSPFSPLNFFYVPV